MFYNGYFSNDGTSGYDKYNATGITPDGILDWNQERTCLSILTILVP